MPENGPDSPERLERDRIDDWKQISSYFGRDIRTVQRWEKTEGLPVHRDRHAASKPGIWASRSELEAWRKSRELREQPSPPPPVAIPPLQRRNRWLPALGVVPLVLAAYSVSRALHKSTPEDDPVSLPDRLFARATSETATVGAIFIGRHPGRLYLSPDKAQLYATDQFDAPDVPEVDLNTLKVTHIHLEAKPSAIAFAPDGRTLYLGTLNDGLYVIDRRTHQITPVRTGIKGAIHDIALTPNGRALYLTLPYAGLQKFDTRTHAIKTIHVGGCPKFLDLDRSGRNLYIGCQCGGSNGLPLKDDVAVLDTVTDRVEYVLSSGAPTVAGVVRVFPDNARLWLDGWDACVNPRFSIYDQTGCPTIPAKIAHVFGLQNRTRVRTLSAPKYQPMGIPTFTPDGRRFVLPGRPARVVDTTFFNEQETFGIGGTELQSPVIDTKRKRLYFSGIEDGKLYVVPLPASDCGPPPVGLAHHWPGDGSGVDRIGGRRMESNRPLMFAPGRVGLAFRLDGGRLEFATPYNSLWPLVVGNATVQFWIKVSSGGETPLAEMQNGDEPVWRLTRNPEGRLRFWRGNGCSITGSTVVPPWVWRHIALVLLPGQITSYVDGQRDFSAACPETRFGPGKDSVVRFGPMQGLLDEVAVYDRTLSEEAVQESIRQAVGCNTAPKNAK